MGVTRRMFLSFRTVNPTNISRITVNAPKHGRTGKSSGRRIPVVVTVILPTILTAGNAASIPSRIPAPILRPYCTSVSRMSWFPVNPVVFRTPKFLYSCSTMPVMLCPRTAMAAARRISTKTARSAQKAFCRILIKPRIASLLCINSVYWEIGVFSFRSLLMPDALLLTSSVKI